MTFIKNLFKRLCRQAKKDKEKGAITMVETMIAIGVGGAILITVFAALPALRSRT